MEISTDNPIDDPDLISLSSISDSTKYSSDSNISFHSLAIMLTSANRWSTKKGLGATAPSKKNKKSKTVKKEPVDDTPADKDAEEEVKEVPLPPIVEDPIAGATMSNVVIGTKLVPIKRIDAKKKLTGAKSSLLQSINGIQPIDISVDISRRFCVRESIPGLGSSASKLKCIQGIIAAKKIQILSSTRRKRMLQRKPMSG